MFQPPPFYDDDSSDSDNEQLMNFYNQVIVAYNEDPKELVRRRYINRDRVEAQERLMKDYFFENPKFFEKYFRRRFRMSKELFLKIIADINERYPWFQQRLDVTNNPGFTCLQKCVSAIRQLTSGNIPDSYNESLGMSERHSRERLVHFCDAVVELYFNEYLCYPSTHDIQKLYEAHGERHGIPDMIGSIDCTYWNWAACPTRLCAQYHRGDHQYPTVMLEAITSQDTWFWHAFFGAAGCNNNINVLRQSPLFTQALTKKALRIPFWVNGHQYKRGYYLDDGGYPNWSTFVKTIRFPTADDHKKFALVQESARKNVERAFGLLKGKWVDT